MYNLQIEEEKEEITVCCMCVKDISASLVPRKCLEKYGRKAGFQILHKKIIAMIVLDVKKAIPSHKLKQLV